MALMLANSGYVHKNANRFIPKEQGVLTAPRPISKTTATLFLIGWDHPAKRH